MTSDITDTARDLTTIARLHLDLLTHAVHKANDRLMPGGKAMVELAPAGSPDEWAERLAAAEFRHFSFCERSDHTSCRYAEHALDEDDDESTLQTLRFWSERWRDYDLEREPSVGTELNYIRGNLNWASENEPAWDRFTKDIARARTRLENILQAGDRAERGVPCMYDECGGVRLVRKLTPKRDGEGNKVWDHTDWHCPRCKRTWDHDAYWRNVIAANEKAQAEPIEDDIWCSVDYAARVTGRSAKTIRTWINRDKVATVCIIVGRRTRFVSLNDVRARHAEAKDRPSTCKRESQRCNLDSESNGSSSHTRIRPEDHDAA